MGLNYSKFHYLINREHVSYTIPLVYSKFKYSVQDQI